MGAFVDVGGVSKACAGNHCLGLGLDALLLPLLPLPWQMLLPPLLPNYCRYCRTAEELMITMGCKIGCFHWILLPPFQLPHTHVSNPSLLPPLLLLPLVTAVAGLRRR